MISKDLSEDALTLIAARFKVLSEPIRLQILNRLQEGEMSVNELTVAVGSSQPNTSKHLKILLREGVLGRRQSGNTVYYSIADESIFEICETVCNALEERLRREASIFSAA